MKKTLYFIRAQKNDHDALCQQLFDDVLPALEQSDFTHIKIGISEKPPRFSLIPFNKQALVMISLWREEQPVLNDTLLTRCKAIGEVWAYDVQESTPLAYEKTWADGEASPGVVLLTLLKKHANISDAEFMHEWHGRHTPKAMRIHPLWNYIRNVTLGARTAESPDFQGFVEEHYKSLSDINNPIHMFGGGFIWPKNMIEIGLHVNQFLDLSALENYLLREYHIR